MINALDRKNAVTLIDEAYALGARRAMACVTLGISLRTYRRWTVRTQIKTDGRSDAVKRPPANQLDPIERESILAVCNEPRFHNLPPSQIVPTLADQGHYIGSESTFYRVLTQANQLAHRGRAKSASKPAKPDGFVAEALELGHHFSGQHGGRRFLSFVPHHGYFQPQDCRLGSTRQ